jgi:uncharacterized protein with NAD-binding domain and iron-sulfur cluster
MCAHTPESGARPDGGVNRRGLLIGGGLVAGAAAAGAAAIPLARTPYDADYPEVPENRADLPANGRSVVIVGGGLAGLQAGVELSERGFRVIVLEKSGTPGGKLKTWRDKGFGPADDPWRQDPDFAGYVREHGLHAVWGFYNNLREFLGRHGWGLQPVPKDWSIYTFLDKDGTRSHIPISSWPAPYNLIHQLLLMDDVHHVPVELRGELAGAFRKLAAFDYADERQRNYMDSMTVAEWGRRLGLTEGSIKILDSIVEMAYFSGAEETSALTMANLTQLVSGSPNDLRINPYLNPPGETFLQPMVDLIRQRGGEVHYNTEVTGFEADGGRITAVRAAAVPEGAVRRCAICGALIGGDGSEIGECPFCGARGDQLRPIGPAERADRRFEGDFYISALDVPGAQVVFGRQPELFAGPYFDGLQGLGATAVYVTNFWVEGHAAWRRAITDTAGRPALDFFATGYDTLGITINWTLPFSDLGGDGTVLLKEYAGRDIAIIETQIAKAEALAGLPTQEIADRAWAELKATIPDLPAYRDVYVNRWHHYTAYRPGDEAKRPPVQSPYDNLLLIGDLAFVPHPAVFMEKTNVTAKWAVNLLLDKIGQHEGRIRILPSGTPSLLAGAIRRFGSVEV